MSMYEIEGLVEETILTIDKMDLSLKQKRNFIYNAYELQNQFDCSFTHFRVIEVLKKNEYVQSYKIKEFPIYKKAIDFFNNLPTKEFEFIRKRPNEPFSTENHSIAYWRKKENLIYADFGTPYYSLHPTDRPEKMDPLAFGLKSIQFGHSIRNADFIYNWAGFMINYLLVFFPLPHTIEELKMNYFNNVKQILKQYNLSEVEPWHFGFSLEIDKKDNWQSDIQKELINFLVKMN